MATKKGNLPVSESPTSAPTTKFDIVIVGAGVSGINAAYRVQNQAPAGTSFAVFEGRDRVGGTWDLFRYPGIRSDSDIFTFGFQWNPWPKKGTLATGPEIREYMSQSIQQTGIDKHIRFGHKIVSANWIPRDKCWELSVIVGDDEKPTLYRAGFLFLGTGYYDYHEPMKTAIPGIENFKGKVIHPQFWPEDYDYTDKSVVVIGSGATAVTIVPAVSEKVKHVTMLQRSPGYIFPLPQYNKITLALLLLLPNALAHWLNRAMWVVQTYLMILFCRNFPFAARRIIRRVNKRFLPKGYSVDPNFTPRYNPWEQRLCAAQDGDFFAAVRSGKASVLTDTIQHVTEKEIKLTSGTILHPDIIVTATGLKVIFAGGIQVSVDGEPIKLTDKFIWRSCMIQDVPNLMFAVGFENASWTLGADCAAHLMTRLLCKMKDKKAKVATPHLERPDEMEVKPVFTLQSTYLKNVASTVPKAGTGVWRPRANYMADLYVAKYGDITTDLIVR